MSSSLETKFTGDSKQLEAAYQKIQRENVKLREEAKKAHEEHKHAGEEQEGLLDRVSESMGEQVAELGKMALAWASVEKAVELVNEEYERQVQLAEKAAAATGGAGAQRGAVLRNLGPVSGDERKEFFERLEEIGLRRGLKEDEADQAVNFTLSATGGDRERALELIDLAARAVPEGGGDTVGQVGRGIEQIRTASHDEDQEANLGRLFSLQKVAPIKDVENIAAYMVPAIQNMGAMGDSFEESGGLFAALAKTSGDVEGRRTRTAVTNLQGALHDFFDPEKQAKSVRDRLAHLGSLEVGEPPDEALAGRLGEFLQGRGVKMDLTHPEQLKDAVQLLKERPEWGQQFVGQEAARMPTAKTVSEQIHALQQNDELRKRFLTGGGFTPEAQARGADTELLRGGSDTAKMFDEASADLKRTNYKQAAQKQLQTIASEPTIQRMQQQRIGQVAEEQSAAGDFQRADVGTALKAIEQMLDQTNQGMGSGLGNWWSQKQAQYRLTQLGEDPKKVVKEYAQRQIFNLRYAVPEGVKPSQETIGDVLSGKMSEEELARRKGIVRTTDEERLRKAKIAEEANERYQAIGRREEGHEEEATEEATPQSVAELRARIAEGRKQLQRTSGQAYHERTGAAVDEEGNITGDPDANYQAHRTKGSVEKEKQLERQVDLQQRQLEALERLLEQFKTTQEQAAQHHNENKTTGRAGAVRASGRTAVGREAS